MIVKKILSLFIFLFLHFPIYIYADSNYHDNEQISIQLKWKHSFQFAGYYAAIEKGYYAKEGLEVTLKERSHNQNYIQSVLDGESEYGVSDSSLVVVRLQQKPVVLVTQIFQYSPLVFISHRDSNITTPYDFIGKKLMYSVNSTGDTPFKALILKTIGSFDKLVTSPFTSYQDFIDRKVDVTSAYSTSQPYWLKKQGIEVNIIDPKSYGIDFYGDNLFTTQSEVKHHPMRVSKIKKATLKGWKYALDHPQEIIDIILKKYAPDKERDALEFEARGIYQMIMPDLITLGSFRKDKYTYVVKTYQQLGIISHKTIPDDFYYHDNTDKTEKTPFTPKERLWIKNHPIIKVGAGPDWAPFDFVNSKGQYTGISNDYLQLLSQKTGLKFHCIVDKWANNLKKMKTQQIDLLHAVYYTKERDTYMHYTKPYFEMLDYFFIRDDLNVTTLKDLDTKRVAMPKGYAHAEILKKEFPKIQIVTVDTFSDAIDAVLSNKADILFDTYASISYKLKQDKISTIIPFKAYRGKHISLLHMAASQNNPLLAKILDKGLTLITPQEKEQIYHKWLSTQKKKIVQFTDAQEEWIKEHPVIKVSLESDWAPFEFVNEDGKIDGFSYKLLQLISQRSGLKFQFEINPWKDALQKLKEQKIDLLTSAAYAKERTAFLYYTKPYFTMNDYFFVHTDLHLKDMHDLDGKTAAIPQGYYTKTLLKKYFPKINIIDVENLDKALEAVLTHKADMVAETYSIINYKLKQEGIQSIKPFKKYISNKIHMVTHHGNSMLISILNKTLATIDDAQKETILSQWIEKPKRQASKIKLSETESSWLNKNPTITFAGNPNWLPFEAFDKDGKYIGIVADYLQEIEKYIPIHFKPQLTHSWQETLELSKQRTIDVISGDIDDSILKRNYNPITPYIKTPIVIIMRNDNSFVNDIADIKHKRIAIIKGYGYTYTIKKRYPLLSFIEENDAKSALKKLSNFHYDALILSLPTAAYFIKTEGLYNLRIVGKTGIEMQPTLFVHKNKPVLQQLLEKTISKMNQNTNTSILNKWQNIEFAHKTDYQLLFQIAGLLGLFLLGTLYWNRKLSHEIKKRKEVEEILQEKKIQIERDNYLINSIFNATSDLIFYKDSSLRYLGANQAYLKFIGKEKEEIVGKDDFQLFDKELASLFRQHDIQTLKENRITTKKEFITTKNAKESYLLTQKVPFLYDKEHTGILGISRDITEIHLSELKAQEANRAKSEFLANMSHEIRTPMNSVLGFSELLEKQINDPIQKDYLEAIQRGGKALLNIINDILDLSKIEAGKLEIILESVNIKQLAMEMESIFSVQLIQKNLHFTLEIDSSLPKYLLLDNTRLRQVLFNLLGNAIKFTSHGEITLAIKKLKEDTQHSKIDLQIIVKDSGIGIAKENIEHIFDAFEQQQGQDKKFGGTGLGLAISKKLIMMMNGDIKVESEVNRGSTFTIHLYDIPISSIEAEKEAEDKSFQNIHFNKATILVVDDIKDNRKLVTSTLKEHDLEVIEAVNGKEAIEHLHNIKIDLILMDIKMPVMDGYEATKIIKADEKLRTIPLIALTASVMGKDLEKIEQYRFDGYLRKPISQEALLEEIAKYLSYNIESMTKQEHKEIDEKTLQNLPQTIKALEEIYLSRWEEIKEMGDFSLISTFSKDLEKLAKENKITLLKKYASQLHTYCESFDIDKVDFLMNSFPATIEKLKRLQDV
jgi:two-component system sensor histidine kinase EvgS